MATNTIPEKMDISSPILLLHSSCKHGAAENEAEVDVTTGNVNVSILSSSVHDDGDMLYPPRPLSSPSRRPTDSAPTGASENYLKGLPIICDILLMPEHKYSANHDDSSMPLSSAPLQVLHFQRNPINPCGISNVLVLDNLPWNNDANSRHSQRHPMQSTKTGSLLPTTSILLSLTSCSISYDESSPPPESASSAASAYRHWLPVDPIPSTFAVTFGGGGHGKDGDAWSENNSLVGELQVEFDFTEASRQAQELQRQAYSSDAQESSSQGVDDAGNQADESYAEESKDSAEQDRAESAPINRPFATHNGLHDEPTMCSDSRGCILDGRDPTLHPCHPSPAPVFGNPQSLHGASPKMHLDERQLLLKSLHSRMQHEARVLDRTLEGLACVGLLLMSVLIWAIYEHNRTTARSNAHAQEIRESMKKTSSLLQEAVDALHQPVAMDSKFKRLEDNTLGIDEVKFDEWKAMAGSNPPLLYPSTPLTRIRQPRTVATNKIAPNDDLGSRNCDAVSTAGTQPIELIQFLRPPSQRSATTLQRATSQSPSFKTIPPPTSLSPCSRFAKEWYERKTVRRSNRKKRGSFLQPISSPAHVPVGRPSNGGYSGEASETSSSSGSSCSRINKNHGSKISAPPKLRSVIANNHSSTYDPVSEASDHTTASAFRSPTHNISTRSELVDGSAIGKEILHLALPPVTSVSYMESPGLPPFLCSTPESEDDSFVDDYW